VPAPDLPARAPRAAGAGRSSGIGPPRTTADIPHRAAGIYVVGDDNGAAADGIDEAERDWRRERPDLDVSSYGIVTRIGHIGHHLEGKRKRLLTELATDRGSMDILAMLRRAGQPYRQTAGQLTKSALITSGGVSQRLDKLERAGLVTRHIDVSDRRRVDVQLTPVGAELVDAVLVDLTAHDQMLLDQAMDPHEQEMLRALLRKLLTSLEPDEAG
jgi:DNA-binding MarR family transcriptional regulator